MDAPVALILSLLAAGLLTILGVMVAMSDDNTPAGGGNTPAGGGNTPAGGGNTPAGGGNTPAGGGTARGGGGTTRGGGVAAGGAAGGVAAGGAAGVAAGGTNPPQAACAGITCNGTNRTKKSASEINAIPPTTDPDEYPDTTFRSPCCKWHNLPNPVEGTKSGINYTDFLNTTEACPIDDSNSSITAAINAGVFVNNGNLCGGFTIQADAGPNTHQDILNDDGKFEINFIHDNPNRYTLTDRCPRRCKCPVFDDSGQYWYKHHWNFGNDNSNGHIRCQDSP